MPEKEPLYPKMLLRSCTMYFHSAQNLFPDTVTVVYFLFFIPSHRRLADKIYKDTINYKNRTNELVF